MLCDLAPRPQCYIRERLLGRQPARTPCPREECAGLFRVIGRIQRFVLVPRQSGETHRRERDDLEGRVGWVTCC
jgi:hypothetical protein